MTGRSSGHSISIRTAICLIAGMCLSGTSRVPVGEEEFASWQPLFLIALSGTAANSKPEDAARDADTIAVSALALTERRHAAFRAGNSAVVWVPCATEPVGTDDSGNTGPTGPM